MPTNVLYRTSATATGGRAGHAATPDGNLKVSLTRPKELGGDGAHMVEAPGGNQAGDRTHQGQRSSNSEVA